VTSSRANTGEDGEVKVKASDPVTDADKDKLDKTDKSKVIKEEGVSAVSKTERSNTPPKSYREGLSAWHGRNGRGVRPNELGYRGDDDGMTSMRSIQLVKIRPIHLAQFVGKNITSRSLLRNGELARGMKPLMAFTIRHRKFEAEFKWKREELKELYAKSVCSHRLCLLMIRWWYCGTLASYCCVI
jgi:hypothetical protein